MQSPQARLGVSRCIAWDAGVRLPRFRAPLHRHRGPPAAPWQPWVAARGGGLPIPAERGLWAPSTDNLPLSASATVRLEGRVGIVPHCGVYYFSRTKPLPYSKPRTLLCSALLLETPPFSCLSCLGAEQCMYCNCS